MKVETVKAKDNPFILLAENPQHAYISRITNYAQINCERINAPLRNKTLIKEFLNRLGWQPSSIYKGI